MVVILHILAALASIACTTFLYLSPTRRKLHTSYALIGFTLASGTYLVISTHARMFQACTTGLFYLAIVMTGVAGARHKLATDTET